jgi:Zn-dependent protease/CBS domain-containing protein
MNASAPTNNKIAGTAATFHLFGIPIRLHFTFLILLAFILVVGLSGDQSAAVNMVYILALFISVLIHELGHVAVSRRYGIKTKEIVMYPIGGVSRMERDPKPSEELWIALVGPVVNLAIAGMLFAYLYSSGQVVGIETLAKASDANLIERIALGNLILGGFNLIPAFPMDGGRILRAFLARFRPIEEATRIAAAAGRFLAIAMLFIGLFNGQFFLMFIAIFVYLGAEHENAAVTGRAMTQGIPVRAAMVTDFHTLPHGSTIRDAAELLLSTSQQDFPVVLGEQVIGLLGRNALLRGMAAEGPESYVSGIMDRNFTAVAPEMDLAETMPVLAEAGTCALVMDGDRLVGLLTRENLSEFVLLRRFGLQASRA